MTLATGLVLAIVVGTIAQKSDTVMAFFGAGSAEATLDDQFTVRAGRDQTLDVQANDTLSGDIVITGAPSCGAVRVNDNGSVDFYNSANCTGEVSFTYCVEKEDACEETTVALTLVNTAAAPTQTATNTRTEQRPELPIDTATTTTATATTTTTATTTGTTTRASTAATGSGAPTGVDDRLVPGQILVQDEAEDTAVVGFGVASAPTLFAPDMQELIQPQETVDTLRRSVAAIAPSQIEQDSNIGVQRSTSAPRSTQLSAGGLQTAPTLGTESAPVVAFSAPAQPRLGGAPVMMAAPMRQDAPVVRGPDVESTPPRNITVASNATNNDPVAVSDTIDQPAATAVAEAPYGQEPAGPPENVDTASADAGAVRVAAEDPADSSDIVVEMAAQILLPGPQLTQTLDFDEQATPEVTALLSDQNFVANLDPSEPPAKEEVVASLPTTTELPPVPQNATCDVSLSATARPGASIELFVSSPCHDNEVAVIEHAGLSYTMMTDSRGTLSTSLPALTSSAAVKVSFDDGATSESRIRVRDAKDMERIAVMWSVPVTIDLHAYENDAGPNDRGHVWEGNARKYRDTLTAGGGFLQVLGDPEIAGGQMAEVYTLPTARLRKPITVRMDLDIVDSSQYCGQAMILRTVRSNKGGDPMVRAFNLSLPSCASGGGSIVLENFVEAFNVARR